MNTIKAKDKNGNEVRVKARGRIPAARLTLLRNGYVLTGLRQKKSNRRAAA